MASFTHVIPVEGNWKGLCHSYRRVVNLLLALVMLIVTGCESMPLMGPVRKMTVDQPSALSVGEIIIFGRILFIENGTPKAPYALGRPTWSLKSLAVTAESDAKKQAKPTHISFLSTDKNGLFRYVIPAGRYELSHVEPFYYMPLIQTALAFEAIEPGRAYYLGDLVLDIDTTSMLWGLWGNYINSLNHLEVRDQFDATRSDLMRTLPDMAGTQFSKSLLARLPGQFPQLLDGRFVPPAINLGR